MEVIDRVKRHSATTRICRCLAPITYSTSMSACKAHEPTTLVTEVSIWCGYASQTFVAASPHRMTEGRGRIILLTILVPLFRYTIQKPWHCQKKNLQDKNEELRVLMVSCAEQGAHRYKRIIYYSHANTWRKTRYNYQQQCFKAKLSTRKGCLKSRCTWNQESISHSKIRGKTYSSNQRQTSFKLFFCSSNFKGAFPLKIAAKFFPIAEKKTSIILRSVLLCHIQANHWIFM